MSIPASAHNHSKSINIEPDKVFNELLTIRDYLRWSVSKFNEADLVYGHGTDNAWDEAVNLVLSSLNLPPDIDQNVLDSRLTTTERNLIIERVKLRTINKIPTAYILNESWYSGLNFYVDDRVLIPRSPIAELIEEEFSPWVSETQINNILDLGTGSGCLAILAALTFEDAQVDAVDISQDALEVATINKQRFDVENLNLYQSDLFESLAGKKYDIIISNPPYVCQPEFDSLPEEYTHEPKNALLSGHDGLEIVRRILANAADYLTPSGVLIVEVGFSQEFVESEFGDIPFTWLQFERGGEGVFLLTYNELKEFQQLYG